MTPLFRAQKRLYRQKYAHKSSFEFPFDARNFYQFCAHHQVEIVVFALGLICMIDAIADFVCGK